MTWTLVNQPTAPADFSFVVAFEDGDSAWSLAPAPAGDVYTLPISSDHYGVGYTCISDDGVRSVTLGLFTVGTSPR